jgi:hypothetical protein
MVLRQSALELDDDPRNAWARCDLAQARLILHEKDEALHQIQMVIDQNPERGVLETVRSGLGFLAESPLHIDGLSEMIALIENALRMRDDREQAQLNDQGR